MNVIKRDGRSVKFDENKIRKAISNAFSSCKEDLEESELQGLLDFVNKGLVDKVDPSVEEIQNLVESALMFKNHYAVASHYVIYREERTREREKNSAIMKLRQAKLQGKDIANQNANVDERSFGGRKGEADSILLKEDALNYYMSPVHAKNHKKNRIYIHDLDSYVLGMHNCLSIPFDKLLAKGFTSRQTDIRPVSSVATAFQLLAVIFQLQSLQQFGGVSATHLDWTMVPYVRKSFFRHYTEELKFHYPRRYKKFIEEFSKEFASGYSIDDFTIYRIKSARKIAYTLTDEELNQAVEGMYHNLNTLQSRSGNQLPFTSINYGTCTLKEGQMVVNALLEGSIKGVGRMHRTAIFPCGIFQYKKGVNDTEGTPNYYLFKKALQSTAKRLYPNYVNCDWTNDSDYSDVKFKEEYLNNLSEENTLSLIAAIENNPDLSNAFGLKVSQDSRGKFVEIDDNLVEAIPSTMGCRTYTSKDATWEEDWTSDLTKVILNNKFQPSCFASSHVKDGRGNICPATIILPTLAMEAKKKCKEGEDVVDIFMDILDKAISDCRDELLERFEWICAQSPASADFMYENGTFYGYKADEGIKSALRHGSLAIGQLGLAECLQILVECNHTTEKGMELAKKIEGLFKQRCAEFKEQYKLNFGVYFTPAENTCFTAMKAFKKKYGIIPNVSDRAYFTNSIHVPVWEQIDPFTKIDIESQLTGYSSAGCITYVELDGNVQNNLEALEQIVKYAMDKDIPYFAINVANDLCECCGYLGEIDTVCPVCGNDDEDKIQKLRRVTGYLSTTYKHFNKGKQAEVLDRYKHSNRLESWNKTQ